jgi:LPS export ABC transporter permease LptF/LPS export ABC transporter permease LptG
MFKILDRYLVREIALPFVISLLVLTFVLMIPPILQRAQDLIAKGVEVSVVARALVLLAPQALCNTIPMSVLLGILIGFGRLSGDREFVTMQACGVSLMRLLRPVAIVALLGTAATAYAIIVALPGSNQAFRTIVADVMEERIESTLAPRVFFDDFPHRVIYVRDLPAGGGWRDVFLGDQSEAGYTTAYFAEEGRIRLDREQKLVQVELVNGTSHRTSIVSQETYEPTEFERLAINLDPNTVFRPDPPPGTPEMTIAQLRTSIQEEATRGGKAFSQRFMIHYKFALPLTCPILALIGLALGASNHRGGRLTSFVFGFGVILVNYVLLYGARAIAMGGRLPPEVAAWAPNIVMSVGAVALMTWRVRAGDQPIRLSLPAFVRRWTARGERPPAQKLAEAGQRPVVVLRLPRLNLPAPRLIDRYISREYIRVFALGVLGLLAIFYISTFIDMMDKLFRGETTTGTLLRYFAFATPRFVYFVVPMSVLVSALVTVGVLTKNSEMLVLRACGISLYRAMAPLVGFALLASVSLFLLQDRVLASTNREADRLEAKIRGWNEPSTPLTQHWRVGTAGQIYLFDIFEPKPPRFSRMHIYDVDQKTWRLRSITYFDEVIAQQERRPDGERVLIWKGKKGWHRELAHSAPARASRPDEDVPVRYEAIDQRVLSLESPQYFESSVPKADQMTLGELRTYISQLRASGSNVLPYLVELQRKVAFPLVTVVMTLIAVPFAITTGRRGAMYGIGIGIVLAIVYFIVMSVFVALGQGGVLTPVLAAWAPNLIFGAAAAYMILTVRT